jgi:hypothetical protein
MACNAMNRCRENGTRLHFLPHAQPHGVGLFGSSPRAIQTDRGGLRAAASVGRE